MKDFPQGLVEEVIDWLFDRVQNVISNYSLVSRAWVIPTQKHHFSWLCLSYHKMEKWRARIVPDPDGVSRHVRKLDLERVRILDLERFEEHLCALTQVKTLCIFDCDHAFRYSSMEWFLLMRSRPYPPY